MIRTALRQLAEMSSAPGPRDAVIALTRRCNARCVMCNIWRGKVDDALEPEHMLRLPPSLRTVNLSGGEPFLRDDLGEFVRAVRQRCGGAQITISTNATLPDRVVAMMAQIREIDPTIRLAVSLDAPGAEHDRIRGTRGAFASVVEVLDRLQADGYAGLRLSMTLGETNLGYLAEVARFADRRGLELGVVAAHACETHLGVGGVVRGEVTEACRRDFAEVIGRWLRSWRPKQWLRAHFARRVYDMLSGRTWPSVCGAGSSFLFLQADGTVYHCGVHGFAMGNLVRQGWDEIWRGAGAEHARRRGRACRHGCWMICTARSVYRARPWPVIGWILLAKPLAHLGGVALAPARAGGGDPDPPPTGARQSADTHAHPAH